VREVVNLTPVRTSKIDFTRSTEPDRCREILRRVNEEVREKQKEERKAARENDALDMLEAVAVMATEAELNEFAATLDT
jgi:hypothetical protein